MNLLKTALFPAPALLALRALLALLACGPAAAIGVAGSASAWQFTATLVDLDPNDGIAPWIAYNGEPDHHANTAIGVYELYPSFGYTVTQRQRVATTPFGAAATDGATLAGHAAASVRGDGTPGGAVLRVKGGSSSMVDIGSTWSATAGLLTDLVDSYRATAFTLSPHTSVSFQARYEVMAWMFDDGGPSGGGEDFNYVGATARLFVFEQGPPFEMGAQTSYAERTVYTDSVEDLPGAPLRAAGLLGVPFVNVGAQPLQGALSLEARVQGSTGLVLVPVPEPAPAALLGAGLVMLAWRRWRPR